MTAHLHSVPTEGCYRCDLSREEATTSAEQTVADLLALLAVFEQKPIAYQWIRPSVIRSIIESGGA